MNHFRAETKHTRVNVYTKLIKSRAGTPGHVKHCSLLFRPHHGEPRHGQLSRQESDERSHPHYRRGTHSKPEMKSRLSARPLLLFVLRSVLDPKWTVSFIVCFVAQVLMPQMETYAAAGNVVDVAKQLRLNTLLKLADAAGLTQMAEESQSGIRNLWRCNFTSKRL